MANLSHFELELLWIQAGGDEFSADTAAAIAQAESGGDPRAFNDTPRTGDLSYGLWQINYYGSLRAGRTAQFGPGPGLFDPLKNALAAVSISNGGRSFSAWSTYTSGAYKKFLTGTLPPSVTPTPPPAVGATAAGEHLLAGWHEFSLSLANRLPRALTRSQQLRNATLRKLR